MIPNKLKWMPALALLLLSGCGKEEETPQPEPTVHTKEVTFHVFTETDYSDARWDESRMKLTLTLKRIRQGQQQETVVLDTTTNWIPFKQLPTRAQKLQLVKNLRDVDKLQEDVALHVSKVVSINGYETVFTYDQTLDRQKSKEVVEVKL